MIVEHRILMFLFYMIVFGICRTDEENDFGRNFHEYVFEWTTNGLR